jgi:hypothetical protein
MSRAKKSLEQWEKEADGLLLDIRKNFIKLGEIMFFAQDELEGKDWKVLLDHIKKWGLRDADLRAARASFLYEHPDLGKPDNGDDKEERIAPELLFAGAKNSKVLFMDKEDQDRLLSGEKFQTVMSNGKVDKAKAWAELSDPQRNMLIGKGGKILTVAEQQASLTGKKNMGLYPLGSLELIKGNVVCTSRNSDWKLQCSLTDFAKMILKDDGFWDALQEAVDDAQQELGKGTARRLAGH